MFDSYGRNIRYLRVSVTDRCNLRCRYCMPEEGVPLIPHGRILSYEQIEKIARAAAGLGFDKIRLTGGEPLVRKGIVDLVAMLAPIPGLATLAMTSNGIFLPRYAEKLAEAGLSSVNISLDTLDPGEYALLTRGGRIEDAIAGIRAARAAGLPVKLNVVVPPGMPETDLERIRSFADGEGCLVQTIRQYRLDETKRSDDHYMRPPPCGDCDRIRLLADGALKPCLHGDASVPVNFGDIEGSLRDCIAMKPPCGANASSHAVSAIGG